MVEALQKARSADSKLKVSNSSQPLKDSSMIMRNSDILKVIIVGAGLGGLGAAVAILLAGHDVLVLESAAEISEVPSHIS